MKILSKFLPVTPLLTIALMLAGWTSPSPAVPSLYLPWELIILLFMGIIVLPAVVWLALLIWGIRSAIKARQKDGRVKILSWVVPMTLLLTLGLTWGLWLRNDIGANEIGGYILLATTVAVAIAFFTGLWARLKCRAR